MDWHTIMPNSLAESVREINERDLAFSLGAGFIPTIGLFLLLAISIENWVKSLSLIGWVLFTWSAYNREGIQSRIGLGLFWLSAEAFLAPVAMLIFLISGESGGLDFAALIANAIIFVVTWMLAWVVGIVIYLVSRRLEE